MDVVVFGENVLVEQKKADESVIIHLPDNAKTPPGMYNFVVRRIGLGVSKEVKAHLKEGSVIMPTNLGPMNAPNFVVRCDLGEGENSYLLLPVGMIGGVKK